MTLTLVRETANFIVQYDDAVGIPALNVANAVLNICEVDLARLAVYMPYMRGGGGNPFTSHKTLVRVVNDQVNGPGYGAAMNFGYKGGRSSLIIINPFSAPNTQIADDSTGYLFVSEMSEVLMMMYGWDPGSSQGEALSRVMAEELHPNSAPQDVNNWLSWARPRPDWITKNLGMDGGLFGRGDTSQPAYGCGMIFIYFLRYQLGYRYDQICQAAGAVLSDKYRDLTKATDDPVVRVNQLIDSHFGTGGINLVGNNPFPLLEGNARQVFLAFSKQTSHSFQVPAVGIAHIRPFFNCPVGDYPYSEYGAYRTISVTASTRGIGIPSFRWRVNGQFLTNFSAVIGATVNATVAIPDPQKPDAPTMATRPFTFDYSMSENRTRDGRTSTITITSRSLDGDFSFDLKAEADETNNPTGPVSTQAGLTMDTRFIIYRGTYYADRERCGAEFENAIAGRFPVAVDLLHLLPRLPDPPDTGFLTKVIQAVDRLREELQAVSREDPRAAIEIAHYAAMQVGVPPNLLLRGADGHGTSKAEEDGHETPDTAEVTAY